LALVRRTSFAWFFERLIVLTAIALLLGLAGSLALSRVLQSLLFEVNPTDPFTLP